MMSQSNRTTHRPATKRLAHGLALWKPMGAQTMPTSSWSRTRIIGGTWSGRADNLADTSPYGEQHIKNDTDAII